jgi:hypothetical protein
MYVVSLTYADIQIITQHNGMQSVKVIDILSHECNHPIFLCFAIGKQESG